jgi:hypothetical protein
VPVDIRLPLGVLFSVLGVLLAGYGLGSNRAIYERSLGVNINLDWGLFLLAFGITMIAFGRHATKVARRTAKPQEPPSVSKSRH